ncbi:hypothetical protein CBM2623_A320047 [Cupriavidus taiwanensis]|nr:hypothetical protein CBM2608_A320047 [Cupriavidus taiwanensis]SPA29346.1 hypothetical protein CBM2623_A320047 [Cupriavidus taiwanensis]SPA45967.1 hypothetical protein CBM2629_A290049 [Cupriavidus taiwanensis]
MTDGAGLFETFGRALDSTDDEPSEAARQPAGQPAASQHPETRDVNEPYPADQPEYFRRHHADDGRHRARLAGAAHGSTAARGRRDGGARRADDRRRWRPGGRRRRGQ